MRYSFFIRSYHRDLCWLDLCLQSLRKNWRFMGDEEIVLCFPKSDIEKHLDKIHQVIDNSKLAIRLVEWTECVEEGYNDQQINKLYADTYCQGEYVLFIDSDCVLIKPASIDYLFLNGKSILLYESWEAVGPAICWKERAEWVMEHTVDFEFMRRLPFVIRREHLTELREFIREIHGKEIRDVIQKRNRMISEFNIMGDFIFKYHPMEYELFEITRDRPPPFTPWQQEWSHSPFHERKPILEALLNQS